MEEDLARFFRAKSGRILAALMMLSNDMDLAEDALQEALLQAMKQWPKTGIPKNGGAWLYTVSKRRLFDHYRKTSLRERKNIQSVIYEALYQSDEFSEGSFAIPEERLRLIFTCCHPALSQEARISLTLKSLCGLNNREIARAFVTSEAAIEQRLTRAKKKIRDAGITYVIPDIHAISERLDSVLLVIYLIYNESYSAFEGKTLTKNDFAKEAIRLARLVYELLPHSKVAGLLALLLFHDARRPARYSRALGFIPLEDQDRTLWDDKVIKEGLLVLNTAIKQGASDQYTVQAAISSIHCTASSWKKTDWKKIIFLYDVLYKLDPSPIIFLNRIVAISNSGCCETAYNLLPLIEEKLSNYQPFHAAKAHIAKQLKWDNIARNSYIKAIKLSNNEVEKGYLQRNLSSLGYRTAD